MLSKRIQPNLVIKYNKSGHTVSNEVRKRGKNIKVIRHGNQLLRKNTIENVFSCNKHKNRGKQVNGEEIAEDLQARSHGFVS